MKKLAILIGVSCLAAGSLTGCQGLSNLGFGSTPTTGPYSATGSSFDAAIVGDGYFAFRKNGTTVYSRKGSFTVNVDLSIISKVDGAQVLGWKSQDWAQVYPPGALGDAPVGTVDVGRPPEPLALAWPHATTNYTLGGNLEARIPVAPATDSVYIVTGLVYDAKGRGYRIGTKLTKVAQDDWQMALIPLNPKEWADSSWTSVGDAAGGLPPLPERDVTTLQFNQWGELGGVNHHAGTYGMESVVLTPAAGDVPPIELTIGFSFFTQRPEAKSDPARGFYFGTLIPQADGSPLEGFFPGLDFHLAASGFLSATINDRKAQLARLAIARFPNPGALQSIGGGYWAATLLSGEPDFGGPGDAGRSLLMAGALEQ